MKRRSERRRLLTPPAVVQRLKLETASGAAEPPERLVRPQPEDSCGSRPPALAVLRPPGKAPASPLSSDLGQTWTLRLSQPRFFTTWPDAGQKLPKSCSSGESELADSCFFKTISLQIMERFGATSSTRSVFNLPNRCLGEEQRNCQVPFALFGER